MPMTLLPDHETQFVNNLFEALSAFFSTKLLTNYSLTSQYNTRTKQLYKKIITRLQHYVPEDQSDWNIDVAPLT